MIKTNLENIYVDLVKIFKEKLKRDLTDEELALLKWLTLEQLK